MLNFENNLLNDLKTGFVSKSNQSNKDFIPQILTNSSKEKILSTIHDELISCEAFFFCVAFVTKSGVASIIDDLRALQSRNICGEILVSQYLNFSEPEALRTLLNFTNIRLRIITSGNFHAKGYIFKKSKGEYSIIIGSSNLTANALSVNNEWNLKVSASCDSLIVNDAITLFKDQFENATIVDSKFIEDYRQIYNSKKITEEREVSSLCNIMITPNKMQKDALSNIMRLRAEGKNKALLISATGTGKTYLSAFDAYQFKAKRLLFVVHRENIATKAMETFQSVFHSSRTMGFYNGSNKQSNCDFIFASNYTLSQDEHLNSFAPDLFDYIVFDETHHLGAATNLKIFKYFKPKFCLGMTATPERTNNDFNVFEAFDYNIAYEVRLQRALEENMLVPFHYYGISELCVDGNILDDNSKFNDLTSDSRVEHIINEINFYSTDTGRIRGLIFCSSIEECQVLANKFNDKGIMSVSLYGKHSEVERENAINDLEKGKIQFIFTVDIFNEGIDIPSVNMVIMLRPTQSAIIFVQQLGRGLRKSLNKDYLTVLDFIGNYSNNYMIPIALFGNRTYNKNELRRLMSVGSSLIPGSSTISFDAISRKRIFDAIDMAKIDDAKALKENYNLLKYELGHIPLMCDFFEHGARDPYQYINKEGSLRNYIRKIEGDTDDLSQHQSEILRYLSTDVINDVRIVETYILKVLIDNIGIVSSKLIIEKIIKDYDITVSLEDIRSAISNINLRYITKRKGGKETPIGDIEDVQMVVFNEERDEIKPLKDLIDFLIQKDAKMFLKDLVDFDIKKSLNKEAFNYRDGFYINEKYRRKDVFRILNWSIKPNEQNVGGYQVSKDKRNCAIFITYNKPENVADSINYEDYFPDQDTIIWFSKSKRTLNSPDVQSIINYKENNMRLPLFIQKKKDEGTDFYYISDTYPIKWEETKMKNGASVVRFTLRLKDKIDNDLYKYFNM